MARYDYHCHVSAYALLAHVAAPMAATPEAGESATNAAYPLGTGLKHVTQRHVQGRRHLHVVGWRWPFPAWLASDAHCSKAEQRSDLGTSRRNCSRHTGNPYYVRNYSPGKTAVGSGQ